MGALRVDLRVPTCGLAIGPIEGSKIPCLLLRYMAATISRCPKTHRRKPHRCKPSQCGAPAKTSSTPHETVQMSSTKDRASKKQPTKRRGADEAPAIFIRVEKNHTLGIADSSVPSALVVVHCNPAALRAVAAKLLHAARGAERSNSPGSYRCQLRPGDAPVRCAMSDVLPIEFRSFSPASPPRSSWDAEILDTVGIVPDIGRALPELTELAKPGEPVPFLADALREAEAKRAASAKTDSGSSLPIGRGSRRSVRERHEDWAPLSNDVVPVPVAAVAIRRSMNRLASRRYHAFGLDLFTVKGAALRPRLVHTLRYTSPLESWQEALRILEQPKYRACYVQIASEKRRGMFRR